MPTFIFFKDGNKLDELVGASPQGLDVSMNDIRELLLADP